MKPDNPTWFPRELGVYKQPGAEPTHPVARYNRHMLQLPHSQTFDRGVCEHCFSSPNDDAIQNNHGISCWSADGSECRHAAGNGHLSCLVYAHEHGAPWDMDGGACTGAASEGRLACLVYAHEHGAPWDAEGTACTLAAHRGHLDCLRYAYEHGSGLGDACTHAAANDHMDCLAYAHEHGAQWGEAGNHAALNGNLTCLQYMHEHGACFGTAAFFAALFGMPKCLKYALCVSKPNFYKLSIAYSTPFYKPILATRNMARRLKAAVRALEDAWLTRRAARVRAHRAAAVDTIAAAWLDYSYRPGGPGAERGRRWFEELAEK
jgi:hypothetical protein